MLDWTIPIPDEMSFYPEFENSYFNLSSQPYLIIKANAPNFIITNVNQAYLDLIGETRDNIVGKSFLMFLPTNINSFDEHVVGSILAFLERVCLQKIEQQLILNIANELAWELKGVPLINKINEIEFLVLELQGRDNVYPKTLSVDPHLLIENNFQHPLFNNYPDAVFTLDIHGNFLCTNNALLDLVECSKAELLELSFLPFIDPLDLDRVQAHFKKTLDGVPQSFLANVISAKGIQRMLKVINLPLVINEQVIGIHVIAKDISESINAKQMLEIYHQRLTVILESITDAFFAVDRNWKVTYWNNEAENLLKMPREEIMGKNLWEVYKDAISLKFFSEYEKALNLNVSVRFEEYFHPLEIWFEVSAFPSEEGLSVFFKDVTLKKNAEILITSEKLKYQELFNLSPIPQWVYDLQTLQFLDVNEAACKNYGYSRVEFLDMTIKEIRPPEDIQQLEQIISSDVKKGAYHQSAVRHQKKDGAIIWVNIEGNSISFEGINARLVLAMDITGQVKAQQALASSELRFKSLVQEGSDLIAILDDAGNYTYVSPTSEPLLGIAHTYFIGKNAFDFIHPEDKQNVLDKFLLLDVLKRVEIPPFRFSGKEQYHWIETVITNLKDDPSVGGIVANSKDVTHQIENKIKMEQSIERFNTVSKATSDAIWDWDFQSGLIVWNKAIKGIFGYDRSKYTHRWWRKQVHIEDIQQVIKQFKLLVKGKKSKFEMEYRFRCADGSYKHVLDRAFLMFNANGEPFRMIGSMQDITDRIEDMERIKMQNNRLQDISWLQSHKVRAPLASIMGLVNILLANKERDPADIECLEFLAMATKELDEIIRDIVKKSEVN